MAKDYYAILDLDRDCTDEEIKAVYREGVKDCLPDKCGNDPGKIARFQELTEAYRTLIDPYKRKLYDKELPIKSYPLRQPTPERVWKEVTDVIILRSDRIGPFQRAVQTAKPIVLEEDKMVVGFAPEDYRDAGQFDVAGNRHMLTDALQLVVGRELALRYIQGTALEEWEREKETESYLSARGAAKPFSSATVSSTDELKAASLWDDLLAKIHRSYTEMPRRTQPQMRASFLFHALGWINETAEKAYSLGATEEATAKGLARAIDRLANLIELPATAVAIELTRHKAS